MNLKNPLNIINTARSIDTVKRFKLTPTQEEKDEDDDDFLNMMSFANLSDLCDCDECDLPLDSSLPDPSNKLALDYNSTNGNNDMLFVKPQKRIFLARDNLTGISIWKWTLPVQQLKPLLEFGHSHRIIFVNKLAKNTEISGVLCNDQLNIRQPLKWVESCAYFFPSNDKGNTNANDHLDSEKTGLGWICHQTDTNNIDTRVNNYLELGAKSPVEFETNECVLTIIKIPPKKLETTLEEVAAMNQLFSAGIASSFDRKSMFDLFMTLAKKETSKKKASNKVVPIHLNTVSSLLDTSDNIILTGLLKKFS